MTRQALSPLSGRVLLAVRDERLSALLKIMGLDAVCACGPEALQMLTGADALMDPFQVLIGADAALQAQVAGLALLTQPLQLPVQAYDACSLHAALAPVLGGKAAPGLALEGIDTGLGLSNVNGDRAFYLKLLERFASSQRMVASAMQGDLDGGDWAELTRRAHTLKGSASNVGAMVLSGLAGDVEQELKRYGSVVQTDIAPMLAALGAQIATLDAYFSGLHGAEGAVEQGNELTRTKLIGMLKDFDGDSIDYFEEHRATLGLPADQLELLALHLQRYEFEAALGLLTEKD